MELVEDCDAGEGGGGGEEGVGYETFAVCGLLAWSHRYWRMGSWVVGQEGGIMVGQEG